MSKSYYIHSSGHIQAAWENKMIPPTTENRDYREYLEWIAEGNEPIPISDNESTEQ